jgi:O-antigen/teichoic acid export membrane protein
VNRGLTILRNILSNWAGFGVNAIVTMLLTPYVLRHLGETRYGIWVLTFSVIGYYGLLDLGFRGGVNQYITRYLSLGEYDRVNECASSAFYALSGLGALICLLSITAAFFVPSFRTVPPELHDETFWCILLVGCAGGVQCAFFPFSAVFTATQRYDLANAIGITTRLITAIGIMLALNAGYGLLALSVVTCGATIFDYTVRYFIARRLVPRLVISRKLINMKRIREISSFGLWNFLISVSAYLAMHADSLIIGSILTLAAVAHFALATGLVRQLADLLGPIGQVFYPVAVDLHANGKKQEMIDMYVYGSRLQLTIVFCVVIISVAWAEDFYRIWLGPEFAQSGVYPSIATIFRVLSIGVVALYIPGIGAQLLLGSGRIKALASGVITESLLNLCLSVVFIRYYGLLGVAFGIVSASIIVRGFLIPYLLNKYLDITLRHTIQAAIRPLGVALLTIIAVIGIRSVSTANNWSVLFLHGSLAGLTSAVSILIVGLQNEEREQYVIAPARLLYRRLASPITTFFES